MTDGDGWFALALGDGVCAQPLLDELAAAAASAGVAAWALFVLRDSDRRLHCEVTVYFPPALAKLARARGARPWQLPLPDNLERLAGDPDRPVC
ncbi:hypothetical protein CXB49_00855 [Chromobacterium sp. ATCC 53434]|uniref:hypothetical protein n=1 Tax=Chromobacterium sp. (strain ATCC 53434 / SC 14030) TaxID=2059672 RepID=UPI000C76973D|nr:hypothetical protein [Chromobacterium sp. ATCC 53434]AUH49489.1 hypothetical protein CXB49_00855 [Chromobacterium sp. ATCC 53434]